MEKIFFTLFSKHQFPVACWRYAQHLYYLKCISMEIYGDSEYKSNI